MTRKLLSLIVILLVFTSTATAKYIPYVEPLDGDWGDVANPWQAPGGFSTILYGRMGSNDDVDVIAYEFIQPTSNWMVEIAVPACGEHFASFAPVVAVIGEGLPDAELPFEIPQDMGAVIFDDGEEVEMPRSQNYLFNRDAQRFTRYSADTLLPAGDYLIAIWEPDGHVGAYALSMIGVHPDYVDAMEADRIDEAFNLVNSGEWMGQDCDAPAVQPVQTKPTLIEGSENYQGTLFSASSMALPRAAHSATLLRDGRVLIAGGMQRDGVSTSTAELYDPQTGLFLPAADMMTSRAAHIAVLLQDGSVLLIGGWAGRVLTNSVELYDPAENTFTAIGEMTVSRDSFSATRLLDGSVLIVGGSTSGSAEIYDPTSKTFMLAGELVTPRSTHTATLLPDGRVLIVGGSNQGEVLASAELYNPTTGAFEPAAGMTLPRYKHGAALLDDGRVLIVGGSDDRDWNGRYGSAEIYDPLLDTFTPVGSMAAERFKLRAALALLETGQVLIAGGSDQVELFNPETADFTILPDRLDTGRFFSTAVVLQDGGVLIAGGYDTNIAVTDRAWIYRRIR